MSATRELARRGHDVACFERARIGNERAGSKGEARIFRCGYLDPLYVRLALGSLEGWRSWCEEAGTALLEAGPFVSIGAELEPLAAALQAEGVPFEWLEGREVARRFPGFEASGRAVVEQAAGVLKAGEILAFLGASARASGADIAEDLAVETVSDAGARVRLGTPAGVFECDVAVLCAGVWSGPLAAAAGLEAGGVFRPSLQQVAYLATANGELPDLPAFVERGEETLYGLRSGRDYKFGDHDPAEVVDAGTAPLEDDRAALERITAAARRLLPGLAPTPVRTERCFYDNTPSGDFVIDRVGRLVLAGGTSGHGFKFAPFWGEVLADLVEGRRPALGLERFRLAAHRHR